MTTKLCYLSIAAAAILLTASCQDSPSGEGNETAADTTIAAATSEPVTLAPLANASEFPDAQLGMGNVTASPSGDSVKISFNFNVKNYELKNQTSDENSSLCNNSAQGQHIHFILDNRPYIALYEPKHEVTLAKNTEHYLMAFLSRSYHLSLKNKGAALVYHFKVDENGKLQKLDDPKTPMVFYSRPKGDYLGKDTENVLFDFYVWNATLGTDYKVKADISSNGSSTSFDVAEWTPNFIKNLPMGKTTVKLTLVDKNGNKVEGPETEVSRDINLAKEEPMK